MKTYRRILVNALLLTVSLTCLATKFANAQAGGTEKVNLNTATVQQLEQLPGVGSATAKKIIAGRPYKSADDLAKAGISQSEITRITPLVSFEGSSESSKDTASKAEPSAAGKIDLNSASQSELEQLPGVGSATAKKIIAGRPYASVDGLAKAGISKSEVAKITPLVTVGESSASQNPVPKQKPAATGTVNLNTATQAELEALPGVGSATARKIIAGRPYKSVDDLAKAGVSKSEIAKITPLATVGTTAGAVESTASSAQKPGTVAEKVDLNSATDKELEELPGVGSATAKKIIAGRPYKSVDDLAKAGVSKSEIAKITPLASVGTSAGAVEPTASNAPKPGTVAEKVDLNSATNKQLEELPGVGAATAKKIIAGRPYESVADLSKAGVSKAEISKLEPLVSVEPGAEAQTSSARIPPQPGMVWVNTSSKIYHREGDPWYGKTKQGKFMTEQDAIQQGYRAAKSSSGGSNTDKQGK